MMDQHPIVEWEARLLRAAECGSDCLRDTWATVPKDLKDELGLVLRQCGIIAMNADLAARLTPPATS